MINADSDSIASVMAVKRLLWRKVSGVTMDRINVIKRPDNITMIRLLGLKIFRIDKIKPDKFDRFVIVDFQPDHNELFKKFKYDVVIDHHPNTTKEAPFKDIRSGYGGHCHYFNRIYKSRKY